MIPAPTLTLIARALAAEPSLVPIEANTEAPAYDPAIDAAIEIHADAGGLPIPLALSLADLFYAMAGIESGRGVN